MRAVIALDRANRAVLRAQPLTALVVAMLAVLPFAAAPSVGRDLVGTLLFGQALLAATVLARPPLLEPGRDRGVHTPWTAPWLPISRSTRVAAWFVTLARVWLPTSLVVGLVTALAQGVASAVTSMALAGCASTAAVAVGLVLPERSSQGRPIADGPLGAPPAPWREALDGLGPPRVLHALWILFGVQLVVEWLLFGAVFAAATITPLLALVATASAIPVWRPFDVLRRLPFPRREAFHWIVGRAAACSLVGSAAGLLLLAVATPDLAVRALTHGLPLSGCAASVILAAGMAGGIADAPPVTRFLLLYVAPPPFMHMVFAMADHGRHTVPPTFPVGVGFLFLAAGYVRWVGQGARP